MAMRKEPQRRYGSVEQLSEDIRRHLEELPVLARNLVGKKGLSNLLVYALLAGRAQRLTFRHPDRDRAQQITPVHHGNTDVGAGQGRHRLAINGQPTGGRNRGRTAAC